MEQTYKSTRDNLLKVAIPSESRTYKPVSHGQLMDLTLNSLSNAGFKVESEQYTSARDGMIANGLYKISNVADSEMALEIAWQNSYNKQISLKFAIGAKVFICQNGMVSGDMGAFKKKHQGTVQEFTPTAITEYIKRAGDVFKKTQDDRDKMKEIIMSDKTRAELIGRMFIEEDFLSITQLGIIARQIKMPEFYYNAPNSMWELYQYTTQAMRDIHPTLYIEDHIKAHNFFSRESGIAIPESTIFVPSPGSHPQGNLFSEESKERFDEVLANIEE